MASVQCVSDALAMIPTTSYARPAVGKVWALHYHSISCICQACKHSDIVLMGLTSPVLDWDIKPDAPLSATQSQDLSVPCTSIQTG